MASAISLNTKHLIPTEIQVDAPQYSSLKKTALIALSLLMATGLILSYALGAPWFVMVGFFLLALSPLFPIGQAVDSQRSRILG